MYSTYINWGFQNYVFSVFSVALFFLTVCSLFCGIFAVMRYAAMRPNTKCVTVIPHVYGGSRTVSARICKISGGIKELHKLVITGKALWAVAALIIIAAYFSTTGQMTFTDAQKEYDKIVFRAGGKSTVILKIMCRNGSKHTGRRRKHWKKRRRHMRPVKLN